MCAVVVCVLCLCCGAVVLWCYVCVVVLCLCCVCVGAVFEFVLCFVLCCVCDVFVLWYVCGVLWWSGVVCGWIVVWV